MYSVSNAYKAAIKRSDYETRLRGTIGSVAFDRNNLLFGSFCITNQCCDTSKMMLGLSCIGELKCTFRNVNIERNDWQGKTITPVFSLLVDAEHDTWEDVPLGVFTVTEANHTAAGVEVTAYDNMAKLDKAASFNVSSGTAYRFLEVICDACSVPLGITREEVEALPNGTRTLGLYADNDIETWRDMLGELAAALGSFATFDRNGALILRQFLDDPVDDLDDYHRFTGASFSDFETNYSGLYVTDKDTATVMYYGTGEAGLTMNIGANPFLQYGLNVTVNAMRQAVCDALTSINYVPFKASSVGNPAYDLGDVFVFSGGIADHTKISCLMKYVFKYNGAYDMQGVGENPALATGNSKVDKNIEGLIRGNEENKVYFYSYRNNDPIEIGDGEQKQIIYVRFAAKTSTHIVFQGEICLSCETTDEIDEDYEYYDAVAKAHYYLNGSEIEDVHPTETWQDGDHILHLIYDVANVTDQQINTFSVSLEMDGGSVNIPVGNSRGVVFGQGLAANGGSWNGNINASDELYPTDLAALLGLNFTDSGTAAAQTPIPAGNNENLPLLDLGALFGFNFTDSVSTVFYIRYTTIDSGWTYNSSEVEISSGNFVLKSGVQSAYIYAPDTTTTVVTRVHCYNSGALFAVSFDHGTTWLKYDNGWTASGVGGMDGEDLENITAAQWAEEFNGSIQIRAQLTTGNTLNDVEIYGG